MMKGQLLVNDKMKKLHLTKITLDNGATITIMEGEENRIRVSCDGGSLLYIIPVVSNVAEIGCVDVISKKKRKKQ